MKIAYASDLHFEFTENYQHIMSNLDSIFLDSDYLVLLGDITLLDPNTGQPKVGQSLDSLWDYLSKKYMHTYIIYGNHEFYMGYPILKTFNGDLQIRPNISYVQNKVVALNDRVNLFLTTLWSQIEPPYEYTIFRGLPDFKNSMYDTDDRLSINNYAELFNKCLNFLKTEVQLDNDKINIVCTHHAPSYATSNPKHINSPLNSAFHSDLDFFIEEKSIDFWLFGHTHFNTDFELSVDSVLLTNQLGYVKYQESDIANFKVRILEL